MNLKSPLKRKACYGLLAFMALVVALTIAHYPSHYDDPSSKNVFLERPDYKAFYGKNYYGRPLPESKSADLTHVNPAYANSIGAFIRQYGLQKAHILEIGAGEGTLQDLVPDYTALEISPELSRFFHKPFVAASATSMPFKDAEFDAIWSVNVLEHVPKPEQALSEMRRVLRNGGLLYLQAAWQCRSWAAEGYQVRPYGDFDIQGKLVKASIPLRDSTAYRALYTFPIRLLRLLESFAAGTPTRFQYGLLEPNYVQFWQSDSDAVNSMDPYEAILWFTSRGDELLSYNGPIHPFLVRNGTIVFRIKKSAN